MLISYKNGQGSIVVRFKIFDSTVSTGAGKTGLTSGSSGLIISTIADNEATATAYTVAGSTIESITTLGTYAAPTATKCRFKEVDATNHKGIYELQIADARYAVSNAKSILVSISGVTGAAECDFLIPLLSIDPYDAVRQGMTALPNATAGVSGGLPLSVDTSGRVDVLKINGTSQTARDIGASVLLSSGTGTGQLDFTSGVVKSNTTQLAGQTVTAAAGVTFPSSIASPTNITAATGIVLSGVTHTGAVIPTVTTVGTLTTYTGNTPQTGDAYARIGANGAGLTAIGDTRMANLDAAVTSRMATYTQPTGFLAATFPGTVASTTNITAASGVTLSSTQTFNNTGTWTGNLTGSVGSVAAAITLPTIPANWITAAGLDATAGAEIAGAVWDEAISGHLTAGTTGAALNAAGAAGDPWATSLPGAYGVGTAGYLIGTYLDEAVSDPKTLTSAYDFAKGTVAMPQAYAADGVEPTPIEMLYMMWSKETHMTWPGTVASTITMSTYELNGTTLAMEFDVGLTATNRPVKIERSL